ncbi:50S ribosomal protein L6 [Spirochaetia bacterium 38H-sp]|uniref:Large ribosomal subunit protein uL6 n=1 Tax=Rarispira pelagica TaxID=3141764 RepID=A0ABU9UEW6_9SPIR
MSRLGKLPIPIPQGVDVKINGSTIDVKGPKGQLTLEIRPEVSVSVDNNECYVNRANDSKKARAFHGLFRQLINNMVIGVTEGFTKTLLINGVGYRAEVNGNILILSLGFSMPIEYYIPDGITVTVEENTKIKVSGIDKALVGKVASEIRSLRPVEPYKGKGVRYENEQVRRKVGKSGVK